MPNALTISPATTSGWLGAKLRSPNGQQSAKPPRVARRARGETAIESHLLPSVYARLASLNSPQVLDIGVGTPSTLEFLAPFRARVCFVDLASCKPKRFREKLGEYAGSVFDVCLFWDLLHYLEPDALSELSDALVPYVYSATLGYSIGHVAGKGSCRYLIRSKERLDVRPCRGRAYREWSQTELAARFDGFEIDQDHLSPDGHLELLLTAES